MVHTASNPSPVADVESDVDVPRARSVTDAIRDDRWFGVLTPRRWAERNGPVESWRQRTECIVQVEAGGAAAAAVSVRVRFLQLQVNDVQRYGPGGWYEHVESLDVGGTSYVSADETVPHEWDIEVPLDDLVGADRTFVIGVAGDATVERIGVVDQVVRLRRALTAAATMRVEPVDLARRAYRLRLCVDNTDTTVGPSASPNEALHHSLLATHTLFAGRALRFVSLIDPPRWASAHAAACRNLHTFPVLAGPPGSRDRVLSSPIPLRDHIAVADEGWGPPLSG